MAVPNPIYISKLKEAGLSNTRARKAVFEALQSNGHLPMPINALIAKTRRYADRSSVYRSVEVLENIGVIKRLHIGWKYKLELSDDFHGHHHHLTCIGCGSTHATHDDENFETQLTKLAAKHGYSITDHQLDIRGMCENCQK